MSIARGMKRHWMGPSIMTGDKKIILSSEFLIMNLRTDDRMIPKPSLLVPFELKGTQGYFPVSGAGETGRVRDV